MHVLSCFERRLAVAIVVAHLGFHGDHLDRGIVQHLGARKQRDARFLIRRPELRIVFAHPHQFPAWILP